MSSLYENHTRNLGWRKCASIAQPLHIINKLSIFLKFTKSVGKFLEANTYYLDEHITSYKSTVSREDLEYRRMLLKPYQISDYWDLLDFELDTVKNNILLKVSSANAFSDMISKYFLNSKKKSFRAYSVLLIGAALSVHNSPNQKAESLQLISKEQIQLAEIVEMIHASNLVHNFISDCQHKDEEIQKMNKMAVLYGDYIYTKVSVALADLENDKVTKDMSNALSQIIEADFMELKHSLTDKANIHRYLNQAYLSTASLLENAFCSTAVIQEMDEVWVKRVSECGKNLGLAYHFFREVQRKDSIQLGPALLAQELHPELTSLILRNFSEPGDTTTLKKILSQSSGIKPTRELIQKHVNLALKPISNLVESPFKQALVDLTKIILLNV